MEGSGVLSGGYQKTETGGLFFLRFFSGGGHIERTWSNDQTRMIGERLKKMGVLYIYNIHIMNIYVCLCVSGGDLGVPHGGWYGSHQWRFDLIKHVSKKMWNCPWCWWWKSESRMQRIVPIWYGICVYYDICCNIYVIYLPCTLNICSHVQASYV